MNIIDTIQESKYIYSTFTKWGLKKYTCDVEYFTEEPLDDLSFVICSILQTHDGEYDKRELGILLGFSLSDYQLEGEYIRYYDVAERKIFEDLLKKIEDEHLIDVCENSLRLTGLGEISVKNNTHYQFYKGTQGIYEHLKLKTLSQDEMEAFPFYEDMGFYINVEDSKQFWPEDELCASIINGKSDSLIERLRLNSSIQYHIYQANKQEYFDLENKNVEIKLYHNQSTYFIEVMGRNGTAIKATSIVNNTENEIYKENLVLECLFQQLWDDKSTILNHASLNQFYDLVDFEELTKDSRTQWEDKELLEVIFSKANQTCWKNISRFCVVESLYPKLSEITDNIDWNILSVRVDSNFLIKEFENYPWDLEAISQDYNRKESVIEELILIQKETTDEWNWDILENRLSEKFILSHLDTVDVNLASYTKDIKDVHAAMLNNLDKRWDWNIVESSFDLGFILSNITSLAPYLHFVELLDRVFTNKEWSIKFCSSNAFLSALKSANNEGGVLASYVLNDKEYIWSDLVIKTLTDTGLLCWQSTPYMLGFECNDKLDWTDTFFENYSRYVTSQKGYSIVSGNIKNLSIIDSHPNWNWDWDTVSSNEALLADNAIFSKFGQNLNWSIVLDVVTNNNLLESMDNINFYIADDQEAWQKFSEIASIPYVIRTFNESRYPWNWTVLTKRMFSQLKLENLGNPLFVDKWDWNYLSQEISKTNLEKYLLTYASHWNWSIVFDRILEAEHRLNLNYLDKIAQQLSSLQPEVKVVAWSALTSKFSFKELRNLIQGSIRRKGYWWDMKLFCQNEGFDVFRDLDTCRSLVDWDALSSSEYVDKSLQYNKKLGIKSQAWKEDVKKLLSDPRNKWNFKLLSSFSSLKDQHWFLSRNKEKLDWTIISRDSNIFAESDKQKLNEIIEKYKSYIDFKVLSERTDINIQQIVKIYPNGDYDYNSLIQNDIIDPTLDLIISNKQYDWDWYVLTSKNKFKPTAEILLDNIDYSVNWAHLSLQDNQSLWSNIDLLDEILHHEDIIKEIDWYQVSGRPYFPIDSTIIDCLPLDKLNWKLLSSRKGILKYLDHYAKFVNWYEVSANNNIDYTDLDFFRKYKDLLDWAVICNNNSFCIDNKIIELFSDYIDWNKASSSLEIKFTKAFVEKYKDRWNWSALAKNKAFHNKVNILDFPYGRHSNVMSFLKQFPCKPKAYHFTHMSNAIKIIRSMKLQSRDLAEGNFSNSAGSNVYRTSKAHRFARFYFAPQSPTQFYNECLGKDSDDHRYYNKAVGLGLPKCPMPVFLVFDVEELLTVMPEKCYYSNGNMQKDSTRSFKVIEDPTKIKAREIYINSKNTFNERQQEFLIERELDFSRLANVGIYCYDEFQAEILRSELAGTKWEDIVKVKRQLYIHENKELKFVDNNNTIRITSDYNLPYELRIEYKYDAPVILNKNMVKRQRGNNIYMASCVELSKDTSFEVYFEVNTPRIGSWLIYKNK